MFRAPWYQHIVCTTMAIAGVMSATRNDTGFAVLYFTLAFLPYLCLYRYRFVYMDGWMDGRRDMVSIVTHAQDHELTSDQMSQHMIRHDLSMMERMLGQRKTARFVEEVQRVIVARSDGSHDKL